MLVSIRVTSTFDSPELSQPVYMVSILKEGLPDNINYPPVITVTCDITLSNNRVYLMDIPSPQCCESCYNRNQYPSMRSITL